MKKVIFLWRGILVIFICINFIGCAKKKCTQSLSPKVECNYQFHDCRTGDVNYNTMPYEVADAVLFAHYFVEGIYIFGPDSSKCEYQICATDANADCRALTLSDLVYLIRIILHDAPAHLIPSSDTVNVIVKNNTITTECPSPIGAILFEFGGSVVPTLLASNMEMMNKDNKVLVWSRNENSIEGTAEVLSFAGNAKLVFGEAVDRDSRELRTSITTK